MLGNRKLISDCLCDIYPLIESMADDNFYVFEKQPIVPGAIYIISRNQLSLNVERVRDLVQNDTITVVLCNPFEGSQIMKSNCERMGINDLASTGKIKIITGGAMEPGYDCMVYDFFMTKILEPARNRDQIQRYQDLAQTQRPWKFLFLNGRSRPQRKYLLERFRLMGLLDQAIWSNLDSVPAGSANIHLWHQGQDLMLRETDLRLLPAQYEYDGYTVPDNMKSQGYIKYDLFNNTWADVYLKAEPYLDTYFSLVTETVFEYPYSFRTEKIWKPVAIGHPFVVAANQGYYRDLHNLGFKTFGHLIDESFDSIVSDQERIERIAQAVTDLCQQDLASFVQAAGDICLHNQQHLAAECQKVTGSFVPRLQSFLLEQGTNL